MREIVLDTETTGLDPASGDRVVEIGCVELENRIATGRTYHVYLDPERDMPDEAFRVHGLSRAFLADKPKFATIVDEFLAFLADSPLVIHNASFDAKFLDAELVKIGREGLPRGRLVDTLTLAGRLHPGQRNSLDALCARYGIDASRRTRHGALLDAELLAEVYAELTGGKQTSLGLADAGDARALDLSGVAAAGGAVVALTPSDADLARHSAFVDALGSSALWRRYGER
ncbi:MAG: DNA polymerase III subunit epsilon [Hyphomicrobiales bacterium]|nr:DNA polymerase III subunit epsilon [Hyphomicrobiales bacterium]